MSDATEASAPNPLVEALEDIDAYLETMPAKCDDLSIGYEAITPYVRSLRTLREAVRWLSSHACLTGDCPHDTQADCRASLADAFRELAKECQ